MKGWIKLTSISKTKAIGFIMLSIVLYSCIYLVFGNKYMRSVDSDWLRDRQLSEAELRNTSLIKKTMVEKFEQDNLSYCDDHRRSTAVGTFWPLERRKLLKFRGRVSEKLENM
jgi:hypothetical protein